MATSRRGPVPKAISLGGRAQLVARIPRDHLKIYAAQAERLGLPMGDFIAMQLAVASGLEIPDYVQRQIDAKEASEQEKALL